MRTVDSNSFGSARRPPDTERWFILGARVLLPYYEFLCLLCFHLDQLPFVLTLVQMYGISFSINYYVKITSEYVYSSENGLICITYHRIVRPFFSSVLRWLIKRESTMLLLNTIEFLCFDLFPSRFVVRHLFVQFISQSTI